MDSLITKLFQLSKTVFTGKDLALLWNDINSDNLNSKIAYYVKQKKIIRLTRGIYAKSDKYDPKELATSIYTPSYISFETVLRENGIIFQHYDTIFLASKWPKTMMVGKTSITFRKLKNIVLYNPVGVDQKDNYSIATVERAFLDTIYLFPNQYFDNLNKMDWEKCDEIVKIYNNKQLVLRLNEYQRKYAK